ncbi:hypothetical protein GVN20_13750 [Runella sp. CRIBMP]|uniref:RHS repeat domain-containing protein n=1 Tax=Runella sp. CRIBMP TaxID=2683261 RepID=UPI0014120FE7|nr:RHS repeat-associated core domain-containing protein [Runella sp. CRIBMP]NBB20425.1 hypothetical protein [Runella sp. CRIBMP]
MKKLGLLIILTISCACYAQDKKRLSTFAALSTCESPIIGCNLFFTLPTSQLVCSNTSITYPGPVGNNCVDGTTNTSWDCISTRNNQTWFYVKALTTGTLRFNFTNSANVDVDGIIWGPLPNNDFSQACNLTTQTPLACDYNGDANVELPCVTHSSLCGGTVVNSGISVQAGQIFIMCILNYANTNTNITISQPTGGSVQYCMAPPVTVNCTFADCNSTTNCGVNPTITQPAIDYLCQQQIIKGYTPQNVSANRILSPSTGASTNIARIDLAKITTLSLLDLNQRIAFANNPTGNTFNAEKFDVPFVDLQTAAFNSDSLRYPKILSYLQYQDGRSPFDRNRTYFEPLSYISRGAVLKVLLEAWNIDENTGTSTLPFSDVPTTHGYYKYIQKAYNLGIVTGAGGSFFPDANCTREDAFLMLYRIMTSASITKPTLAQINAGFFIPNTFRPDNLGVGIGNDRGNFNHYTKTSFAIDGTVPLVFAHSYNSYTTELPDSLFNNPLGRGWTHSFNCYVLAYGESADPNRRRIVHYPDGTLHYYKENSSGTWVPESIGVFDTMIQGSGFIEITTPSKVVYRFETQAGKAGKYMLIKSIKDRNNNTLTFTNELGDGLYPRLKSVADPAGRTLNFLYKTSTNWLTEVNLSGVGVFNGRKITFDYHIPIDGDGYPDLKEYKEPDLNGTLKTTTYGYFTYTDSTAHLLKTITLPKGNVIDNTYQQRKLTSSRTMNGANVVQKMDVNLTPNYAGTVSSSSSVVKTTDENGLQKTTNYNHNTNGLPTQVTTTGTQPLDLGMDYGNSNDPTAVTRLMQNGTGVRIQYYSTPPYNVQLIKTAKAAGDSITQSFTYNGFNDVLTSTNGRGFTTTFEYNGTGNLTKITDPLGKNTLISRRTDGLVNIVTTPTGIQTTFGYNTYGNLTSTSVANGANPAIATSALYDALSRLTTTTDPRSKQTTYEYYANDLLKKTTAPMSVATNYNYDANDNLTTITNAKGFATTMSYNTQTDQLMSRSFGGKTESFTYYDDGSLKTYTNKHGNVFTFTYDASGRVKTDSYATYDYNPDGTLNTISNTSNGRNYILDYDYDLLKRISKTTLDSKAVQYAYDNNNNLTTLTYPDGKTVTYGYDNNDRLSTVTDWANRTTTYSYDDDGKLLNYTLPNGMKCIYTYDAAGRMTGMRNEKTGAVVLNSYTYVLDAAGNHLEENIVELYSAAISLTAGTTNYTTDNANLQTQAGSNTYGFDNNGAITTQAGQTLTYDTRDNLLTGYGNSYYYDGNETRRAKIGKRYIINELTNSVIAETDDAGTYQYYYVYGPTGLLYRQSVGGTTEFYHYDFRGSTIATTNATQTVVRQYQYDAFGKILQQTPTTDDNPFRYVGQHGVQYENANLYFMRARYYDPTTGRFVSEDPIWATNLYPYADNNPVMRTDASGLLSVVYNEKKNRFDIEITLADKIGSWLGGDVYDRIKETKEVVSFLNKNLKDIQTQEERVAYFYEFIENVDTYYGPYVTPGVLKLFKTPGVLKGINAIMGYDPVKFSEDEEAYEKYLESIDNAGRGSYKNVKVK